MSDITPDLSPDVARPDAPAGGEGYRVQAGPFDGPLDLLLHLVRANEIDIMDIPIVAITEQYTAYLELMRELDLEIAGEYLLMAATLVHIKSQMLLPREAEAGEGEAPDPRADLVHQLLDYQRFRQAAENLQAMESRRTLIWTRDEIPGEFEGEELIAVDMVDLMRAFKTLLGRLGDEARLRLKRDNVSVAEKIAWLTDLLEERRSVDLLATFAELPTRLDRIAAFLAVLEMMRLALVVVFQRKHLGEIRVALRPEPDGAGRPA
jgi:segregation and condensation protein A